jgi:energy-converting hydrogenase Eha subunit A
MRTDTSHRLALILAIVALALGITAVVLRVMRGRPIDYVHIAFLLGLAAFIISLAK